MKLCKIILTCSFAICLPISANDAGYLIQVLIKRPKVDAQGSNDLVMSVQTYTQINQEFYARSVIDGQELVLLGKVKDASNEINRFDIEYYLKRNDLSEAPKPTVTLKGKVSIARLAEPQMLNNPSESLDADLTSWIVMHDYQRAFSLPGIGHISPDSNWVINLIDEDGNPVPKARTAMYDENWEQIIGVSESDDKGIVRRRQREELPLLIFVAEHRELNLFANAHIDRDHEGMLKIVMKKGTKKPTGFPDDLYK